MKCAEFEILLCDYIDGTAAPAERRRIEDHMSSCPSCATLAADCGAAAELLRNAESVEPPAELINKILFHAPATPSRPARNRGGLAALLAAWFAPMLQPRLAMGMAMTILSFSMVGRILGIEERQITLADLQPARVANNIDLKIHRAWDRAVKYYERLRVVYLIQTQLREWSDQEEAERRAQSERSTIDVPAAGASENEQRGGAK
jgi:hypothetical protein